MQDRRSRRSSCREFPADNSAITEMTAVNLFHTTGNVTCTVTGQRYFSLLQQSVIQALQERRCKTTTVFMQIGAIPHIARCMKQLLRRHFDDNRIISRKFSTAWPKQRIWSYKEGKLRENRNLSRRLSRDWSIAVYIIPMEALLFSVIYILCPKFLH